MYTDTYICMCMRERDGQPLESKYILIGITQGPRGKVINVLTLGPLLVPLSYTHLLEFGKSSYANRNTKYVS